ncbi:MAG: 6-phosphofructokinase [Betaproteobacteria bacterium]|nr:6-phosphofructokinase [Betaproteobacteria bacterium]
MKKNKSKAQATGLLYAQSGGVTAAINSSAKGALEAAVAADRGRVLAGSNGILGVLEEELVDVRACGSRQLAQLRNLPGGAFGSCRYKLPDPHQDPRPYQRIADVFRAHQIGSFLYNGGNDSQDTTSKIAAFCKSAGVPVACVGIPKTIDNDLVRTDCCPGFGSAAKYIATSVAECALDVASMARTSTKLFVIEVMGRDAGWLTAAAGLAGEADSPIMLLLPEVPFAATKFVRAIRQRVSQHGYCIVACSEGVRNARGELLASRGGADAFAHVQLGGAGSVVAQLAKEKLGLKYHLAIADYMQRAARHLASRTDLDQAEALGKAAAQWALAGHGGVMASVRRLADSPYRWKVEAVPLASVANRVRQVPKTFISADGFSITAAARRYMQPLISGEDWPPFRAGLPVHRLPRRRLVARRLGAWKRK